MTAFDERPRAMRYITRVEHSYQIGWRVTVGQKTAKQVCKYFGDASHGGMKRTLKRAQRFRDKMLWSLFQSTGHRRLSNGRQLNEKHGLPGGVFYQRYKIKAERKPWWREHFLAIIFNADGQNIRRTFSVKKHGYAKAKRMALECRKQSLAEKQQQQ